MGAGVSGIYAMIFIHHGHISPAHAHGGRKRWRYTICSYPRVFLIGFQDQRLMTVHLCPECSGDILCAVHNLSALIVQAQDRLALRDESLLLHTRLSAQRSGYIVQVPHFIPLVGSEGYVPFCQGHILPQTCLKLKGVP